MWHVRIFVRLFFFQAEDGIRDLVRSRGLGDVYKRQPVERHRGVVGDDGTATVYTMMPSALQLFAEGRLPLSLIHI